MGTVKLQVYKSNDTSPTNKDGEPFLLDLKVARVSQMFNTVFGDLAADPEEEIPFYYCSRRVVEKVIEWMTHYQDYTPPASPWVTEWDYEYLQKLEFPDLCELLQCAEFMDVQHLVTVIGEYVKWWMMRSGSDRRLEELRRLLKITND